MKKGMVYVEAIVSIVVVIILIASISKIIVESHKNLNSIKLNSLAFDIAKNVGEVYKSGNLELDIKEGIELDSFLDFENYIKNKVAPYTEGKFTLYTEIIYIDSIEAIKIKVKSKEKAFNDINLVVAK